MINIMILNWNSSADVLTLLSSIQKSNYKEFRVIIIDNFSDDSNALNSVKKTFPEIEVHLIFNESNFGYAKGNNLGFSYLEANELDGDVLIVNPDVKISVNTLQELVFAKNQYNNIGAVMIRTFDESGVLIYDKIKLTGFKQSYTVLPINFKGTDETDYCAGSCFLLDRNLIRKIGLFDEDFFLYWEEVDLSLRIRESGYKLLCTTKSSITRKSNSLDRGVNAYYYYIRNSFILKRKWPVECNSLSHFSFIVIAILSSLINGFKKRDFRFIKSSTKGLLDGIHGKSGVRAS
ncbi:glycosyltransferase family 2 protein [Shewanella sp. 1180_01]|uniref:glycosyltransferase family 2 protein n=1 Tax=Shewanella sp. 1180_01 TaxID=2604451 RepID=UPI004062DE97